MLIKVIAEKNIHFFVNIIGHICKYACLHNFNNINIKIH